MIAWKDLDPAVLETMLDIGGYYPCSDPRETKVIRYEFDEVTGNDTIYDTTSDDLKRIAHHLMVVSRWLEQRADEERIKNDRQRIVRTCG